MLKRRSEVKRPVLGYCEGNPTFLGAGFAAIVAVLLIYAGIGKARRRRALVKTYGAPFADGENSAEDEALEGKLDCQHQVESSRTSIGTMKSNQWKSAMMETNWVVDSMILISREMVKLQNLPEFLKNLLLLKNWLDYSANQ